MTIPMPEPVILRTVMPDDYRYGHVYGFTRRQMEAYADARVREVQQWQPIETAPKDGKPRLLFARLKSATASTIVVGSLIENEWLAQSYVGQGKAVLVPSHWMPLPPFPATPLPGPVEPTT